MMLHDVGSGHYKEHLRPLIGWNNDLGRAHYLRHALTDPSVFGEFPLVELLELATLCPSLKILSANKITFDGIYQDVYQPWVCTRLRKLNTRLLLIDPAEDMKDRSDMNKVARELMAQLGTMTELQKLGLNFCYGVQCSSSPLLQLALGVENGLEQLARLSRLESFTIRGLFHRAGEVEVIWMAGIGRGSN